MFPSPEAMLPPVPRIIPDRPGRVRPADLSVVTSYKDMVNSDPPPPDACKPSDTRLCLIPTWSPKQRNELPDAGFYMTNDGRMSDEDALTLVRDYLQGKTGQPADNVTGMHGADAQKGSAFFIDDLNPRQVMALQQSTGVIEAPEPEAPRLPTGVVKGILVALGGLGLAAVARWAWGAISRLERIQQAYLNEYDEYGRYHPPVQTAGGPEKHTERAQWTRDWTGFDETVQAECQALRNLFPEEIVEDAIRPIGEGQFSSPHPSGRERAARPPGDPQTQQMLNTARADREEYQRSLDNFNPKHLNGNQPALRRALRALNLRGSTGEERENNFWMTLETIRNALRELGRREGKDPLAIVSVPQNGQGGNG